MTLNSVSPSENSEPIDPAPTLDSTCYSPASQSGPIPSTQQICDSAKILGRSPV